MMKKAKKFPFLLAACLSTVILAIINSSFGVMLVPMTEHYLDGEGASRGYPNSAMQIGCIVAVLTLAVLGGRVKGNGKTLLLAASALVMAASMLALGGEPSSFVLFVGIFAVVGLAFGVIDVISSALVADVYGESASGMMCLLHGSHGAAGIIAPIIITFILSKNDSWGALWTLPYTFVAGFVVFVLIYLSALYLASRKKATAHSPVSADEAKLTAKNSGFDRALLPVALAIALYGVYLVGMINYTEVYENSLDPEKQKLFTLSLLYVGLTVSRLVLPTVSRITGLSSRTYLAFAPIISSALLFGGILAGNATVYIVLSAISSLIAGAFIPIALSVGCEIMAGNTTGASTYMNLAMLIGNSVSSPLIGAVGGAFGMNIGMLIPATAILLCGVCACVGRK